LTLRTAMRFGDFSKNISKPLDRTVIASNMSSVMWKPMTMTASASLVRSRMVSVSSVKSQCMRMRAISCSRGKLAANGSIIDSTITGITMSGRSVRSGWVSMMFRSFILKH